MNTDILSPEQRAPRIEGEEAMSDTPTTHVTIPLAEYVEMIRENAILRRAERERNGGAT